MELRIQGRSTWMWLLALIIFMSMVVSYVRIMTQRTQEITLPTPSGRGKIMARDGTLLAMTRTENPGTFQQKETRIYPLKTLAAQVVGIMGQTEGLEGLERAYDSDLKAGKNLRLTIDPKLQADTEQALNKHASENRAKHGGAIIMDISTGELLAVASWPPLDPTDWRGKGPEILRNRPLIDRFEPGSVIKPLSVAAALDVGAITPDQTFDTPMVRRVGGRWASNIGDSVAHGPRLNIEDILRYSSNVGMSHIVEKMTNEQLLRSFQKLGFGRPVELGKATTASGTLQPINRWDNLVRTTNSFGQGMSVTLLQLAVSYAALGNNGTYVTPRLTLPTENFNPEARPGETNTESQTLANTSQTGEPKAPRLLASLSSEQTTTEAPNATATENADNKPDVELKKTSEDSSGAEDTETIDPDTAPAEGTQAFQKGSTEEVRKMLRMVIELGIPHAAMIEGYELGGKTGTAQVVENNRYSATTYESTFVGFYPAEKPEIVVAINAHGAEKNYNGSQLAAPIYKEIVASYISQNALPYSESLLEEQKDLQERRNKGEFMR